MESLEKSREECVEFRKISFLVAAFFTRAFGFANSLCLDASRWLLACLRVETAAWPTLGAGLAVERLTPVYNATSCGHIQAELTDLNDRASACF